MRGCPPRWLRSTLSSAYCPNSFSPLRPPAPTPLCSQAVMGEWKEILQELASGPVLVMVERAEMGGLAWQELSGIWTPWRPFLPLCFPKVEPFLLCAQSVTLLSWVFVSWEEQACWGDPCVLRRVSYRAALLSCCIWSSWSCTHGLGVGTRWGDLAVGNSCVIYISRTPCATRNSDKAVVSSFRGMSSAEWAREGGVGKSGKSKPLIL